MEYFSRSRGFSQLFTVAFYATPLSGHQGGVPGTHSQLTDWHSPIFWPSSSQRAVCSVWPRRISDELFSLSFTSRLDARPPRAKGKTYTHTRTQCGAQISTRGTLGTEKKRNERIVGTKKKIRITRVECFPPGRSKKEVERRSREETREGNLSTGRIEPVWETNEKKKEGRKWENRKTREVGLDKNCICQDRRRILGGWIECVLKRCNPARQLSTACCTQNEGKERAQQKLKIKIGNRGKDRVCVFFGGNTSVVTRGKQQQKKYNWMVNVKWGSRVDQNERNDYTIRAWLSAAEAVERTRTTPPVVRLSGCDHAVIISCMREEGLG